MIKQIYISPDNSHQFCHMNNLNLSCTGQVCRTSGNFLQFRVIWMLTKFIFHYKGKDPVYWKWEQSTRINIHLNAFQKVKTEYIPSNIHWYMNKQTKTPEVKLVWWLTKLRLTHVSDASCISRSQDTMAQHWLKTILFCALVFDTSGKHSAISFRKVVLIRHI